MIGCLWEVERDGGELTLLQNSGLGTGRAIQCAETWQMELSEDELRWSKYSVHVDF